LHGLEYGYLAWSAFHSYWSGSHATCGTIELGIWIGFEPLHVNVMGRVRLLAQFPTAVNIVFWNKITNNKNNMHICL
jgi:hypothetical protein